MLSFRTLFLAGLALAGSTVSASASSFVQDLTPSNFDSVVLKSGKPSLVEFFAPWCGHCKNLAPVYEDLAISFSGATDKVTVAKVDADQHKSLGQRFGVKGFPTLKWFDGKSETPVDYTGGRDIESLSKWITDKTGVKSKVKKAAPSSVEMLTDKTFAEVIGSEKDVLVAFTAPWCGHCKSLAPTWESLAEDFASEPTVVVAKVDAEAENSKATAQKQGVTGYPTIKYFPKGSKTPEDYNGGRDEASLISFINEKAGTHRSVGGGLDATAGTIAALDAIVAKAGGSFAGISDELTKAAGALKDKYAEYYTKVATKITANKDYATKELARLDGILKKGGLAREKQDDLISRSNVLRKFLEDTKAKVGEAADSASSVASQATDVVKEKVESIKQEL